VCHFLPGVQQCPQTLSSVLIYMHGQVSADRMAVFTARRNASALCAVVVCLSVRPSVTSRYCIEATGRIELF